jgi:hypothetical protein
MPGEHRNVLMGRPGVLEPPKELEREIVRKVKHDLAVKIVGGNSRRARRGNLPGPPGVRSRRL